MYDLFARESARDLLSESSELLVVSLELLVDSLLVEFVVLLGVVTEVFNACEGSGESLGSGLQVASEGAKIGDLPSEKLIGAVEVSGFFGSGLKVDVVHAANGPVLDV
jgi:hypothetical protein